MSLFCRHNRFMADCPICSKGTVLDGGRTPARRRSAGAGSPRAGKARGTSSPAFSGRYVSAGPYSGEEGEYEVRLERVPGGVRLAEWDGSGLRRRAPVLAAADVSSLVDGAAGVLDERDAARLADALKAETAGTGSAGQEAGSAGRETGSAGLEAGPTAPGANGAPGVSRGRSGDFKEELRVEPVGDGLLRIARWVLRPGSGWQLQEAPPMLPAARYAEALADAGRQGLLTATADAGGSARL